MKLSEAIREGSKHHPQVTGAYAKFNQTDGTCVGTCAIGAAWFAITGSLLTSDAQMVAPSFYAACSVNLGDVVAYPAGVVRGENEHLSAVIVDLNDNLGWTREEIADWLESIGY